jgi:hypothetical protein
VRPAAAIAVLGLAVAVGVPTVWSLNQAPATAGPPVEEVLEPTPPARPPTTPLPPLVPAPDAAPRPVAPAPEPVRVAVPSLGIDAAVDPVGVDPDGQLTIPADIGRVGWYRFGPVPGNVGSAVLAGHVDDVEQGLGVLAPLREAAVGQEVVVTDAEGTTTRWQIVSRGLIPKGELPLDRIFNRSGPPRLVLLTCGGPFLPEYRSYRDNLVVIAEPVS